MMKVVVDYPDFGDELTVVQRSLAAAQELHSVISADSLRDLSARPPASTSTRTWRHTPSRSRLRRAALASTTLPTWSASSRTGRAAWLDQPRARRPRARALRGRAYALPQDVRDLAKDVLRHRLVLTYEALADEVTADQILDAVIEAVRVPEIDLARENAA